MPDFIADDGTGLAILLESGQPVVVGFYPDLAEEDRLLERTRVLAVPRKVHEVSYAEDALEFAHEDALIVIRPENEAEAVRFLDRNRDHFEDGQAKVLLLLLRGGSGEIALRDAVSLASFARAGSFDLTPGASVEEAAETFKKVHGVNYDEWLRGWRSGEIPDTLENSGRSACH